MLLSNGLRNYFYFGMRSGNLGEIVAGTECNHIIRNEMVVVVGTGTQGYSPTGSRDLGHRQD